MINITRKKDTDTQKSLALGMFIGMAATLIVSSKRMRSRVKRTATDGSKNALHAAEKSANSAAAEVKQKTRGIKNKVSDKE